MEVFYVIAGLRLAQRHDVFNEQEPIANKLLFLKCPDTQKFHGVHVIQELSNPSYNFPSVKAEKVFRKLDNYSILELLSGLHNKEFYVLDELNSLSSFSFKLKLRTADEFDFFDSPLHIKQNIVYYIKIGSHVIQGPHVMKKTSQFDHIKKALASGTLFVPSKSQSFEPYISAKAS